MPPKKNKKVVGSRRSTQDRASQRKNAPEVVAEAGDELEHLAVEPEERYV